MAVSVGSFVVFSRIPCYFLRSNYQFNDSNAVCWKQGRKQESNKDREAPSHANLHTLYFISLPIDPANHIVLLFFTLNHMHFFTHIHI